MKLVIGALLLWVVCSAIWVGGSITYLSPAFLPSERERLAIAAVPADCRKAKSADACAEVLSSLGRNPFAAYGYADVLPLYTPIERAVPPYLKIALASLIPPLGLMGLGFAAWFMIRRQAKTQYD